MRTLEAPRAVVAIALAMAAACSLTDLDGYTGGGATVPSDAASAEAGPVDASAGDAATDAGPFCDRFPSALYCNDFDRDASALLGVQMAGTGNAIVSGTDVRSPPSALLATATKSTQNAVARLSVPIAGSYDAVKLSFALRLPVLDSQPTVLCEIAFGDVSLQIIVRDSGYYTQEQEPTSAKVRPGTAGRLASSWTRVELTADLVRNVSTFALDGKVVEQVPLASTLYDPTQVAVRFGLVFAAVVPGGDEIRIDDVLVERP